MFSLFGISYQCQARSNLRQTIAVYVAGDWLARTVRAASRQPPSVSPRNAASSGIWMPKPTSGGQFASFDDTNVSGPELANEYGATPTSTFRTASGASPGITPAATAKMARGARRSSTTATMMPTAHNRNVLFSRQLRPAANPSTPYIAGLAD